MKILLLGQGAGMHALVWKIVSDPRVRELYCAPGSAGTALLLGRPPVSLDQPSQVVQWTFSQQVDLVVAPQMPEWAQRLAEVGLPVLGADERGARVLGSRGQIHRLLAAHGVPCVERRSFEEREAAERYLASRRLPLWIRADDARYYEAVRVEERYEAFRQLQRFLDRFSGVSIEADLSGPLLGVGLLTDGQRVLSLGVTRLYERLLEGGEGPVTEGMGGVAPFGGKELERQIMSLLARPVVAALAAEGLLRPALLQLYLVQGPTGPLVRHLAWGLDDLQAAAILPRWQGEIAPLFQSAAQGALDPPSNRWKPDSVVVVSMVTEGYPGPSPQGLSLNGLYDVDALVFHHATRLSGAPTPDPLDSLPTWLRRLPGTPGDSPPVATQETAGGRVLLVVGQGATVVQARRRAYAAVRQISFPHARFRSDIGAELQDGPR